MKQAILLGLTIPLLGVSATVIADDDDEPVERCEVSTCFNQLRMRSFEVVDDMTMIVYIGPQECPFLVELTGVFCDISFLPGFDVVFTRSDLRRRRNPDVGAGIPGQPRVNESRVCANDLGMGIAEDVFSFGPERDANDLDGLSCRLQDVRSLTDDEILEIYVDKRFVPPPPPFGTGSVQAPEQAQE